MELRMEVIVLAVLFLLLMRMLTLIRNCCQFTYNGSNTIEHAPTGPLFNLNGVLYGTTGIGKFSVGAHSKNKYKWYRLPGDMNLMMRMG
jgi:hypothetical protein